MKKLLIALTALSVLFISAITFVTVWQEDNIESILMGIMENSEEIERQRNDNQIKLVNDVNTYMEIPVREITEEEKELIEKGETTVTDVYQKIFEEKSEEHKTEETPNKDEIVSRYMAELYRLQNEFTARAEATIRQGANYYEGIKDHEQDAEARAETISHFTPVVRNLESECDAKVEALIKRLEEELRSFGADTSIIASIRATYANEKQLKLSYYANKYLK
ncbi:MAG: hypothetical protein E7406_02985 [Ruminococcaceae bacterium]|nr:hypothetical protein [Oscillospiraceae bacterium]